MLTKKIKPYKTKYSIYVASSIDGRISLSSTKKPTWTSKEDWVFFQKALKVSDAIVSGHNTYKAAKSHLDKRNTYVLTSKVKTLVKKGNVKFINPKHIILKKLFGKYKNVAIVGGGMVYQKMLDLKLVDDMYVTIEPLIFGRGKEMFAGGKKTAKFRLMSVKKLNKTGTLLLHYKI